MTARSLLSDNRQIQRPAAFEPGHDQARVDLRRVLFEHRGDRLPDQLGRDGFPFEVLG